MNIANLDYSDLYKSPIKQICMERGIRTDSLRQMWADLGVKFSLSKLEDIDIDIDIPDNVLIGRSLAWGILVKEIRKYTPQIIDALKEENPTKLINKNNAIAPTASNHLSFTLPGTGGIVESITAVIDGAGLTKLSKWIKPTSNNPTGINLNLKLGEQQKGGKVTKPVLPVPSIISSSNSSVESFIADVEKAGVSLAYADERLQIDASRLMETPTGSAVLSSIIEGMKVYMSANKDELLKYLQTRPQFLSV